MPACPICQSQTFTEYRGRKLARCAGCGAKERGRLMALVLKKLLPAINGPVLHLAPEEAITRLVYDLVGDRYAPADIMPEVYQHPPVPVMKLDLSALSLAEHYDKFGAIIHSHVLEHVRAPLDRIIRESNKMLKPGGLHIFQVPIDSKWYREDMDPDLPLSIRAKEFTQHDHCRVFGSLDFDDRVTRHFVGFGRLDLEDVLDEDDLRDASVPASSLTKLTGHSVFAFRKRGRQEMLTLVEALDHGRRELSPEAGLSRPSP
jgi:SAM-dependent methyltransferase